MNIMTPRAHPVLPLAAAFLPLTLAPGKARVGSLFFPMVPNPRSLSLRWSGGSTGGGLTLPLDSVHGLHVKAPVPAPAGK
jgi:hypothetical protein